MNYDIYYRICQNIIKIALLVGYKYVYGIVANKWTDSCEFPYPSVGHGEDTLYVSLIIAFTGKYVISLLNLPNRKINLSPRDSNPGASAHHAATEAVNRLRCVFFTAAMSVDS